MTTLSRRSFTALGAASAASLAAPAIAQGFPTRPITMVVGFAAGGSTDVIARIIAQKMSENMGQQVIVENVVGGGGSVGTARVQRAAPDGYTILMGTITHVLNALILKKVPYNPLTDFTPVSLLVIVPNVLVVNPAFPAKTVKELIELAKKPGAKIDYASSGIATPLHLSGELFNILAGTKMQHVPYRGSGPALNDVVANQVPVMFDNLPSSSSFMQAGTLRALGVTTKTRAKSFPDVPTIAESGLPDYETYTWNALFGPKGVPKDVLDRLNAEAIKALRDPTVQDRMATFSAESVGSTPAALDDHVKAEMAKWAPIVKEAGISLDQ